MKRPSQLFFFTITLSISYYIYKKIRSKCEVNNRASAILFYNLKDYQKSILYFLNYDDLESYFYLAKAYFNLKDYKHAVKYANLYSKSFFDEEFYILRFYCYYNLKMYKNAFKMLYCNKVFKSVDKVIALEVRKKAVDDILKEKNEIEVSNYEISEFFETFPYLFSDFSEDEILIEKKNILDKKLEIKNLSLQKKGIKTKLIEDKNYLNISTKNKNFIDKSSQIRKPDRVYFQIEKIKKSDTNSKLKKNTNNINQKLKKSSSEQFKIQNDLPNYTEQYQKTIEKLIDKKPEKNIKNYTKTNLKLRNHNLITRKIKNKVQILIFKKNYEELVKYVRYKKDNLSMFVKISFALLNQSKEIEFLFKNVNCYSNNKYENKIFKYIETIKNF